MTFRKPSPAMVVAIIALVMAGTGSAVAAVNFARNAGKVDGKDAVKASANRDRAAGNVVATRKEGVSKGKIPNKFLAQVPQAGTFNRISEVNDNQAGAITPASLSPLGLLTVACNDQDANQSGQEDPTTTVTFVNNLGAGVNYSHVVGQQPPVVVPQPAATQQSFTINGSNVFRIHVEANGVNAVFEGQVRQDGRDTAAASCVVVGTVETFTP